MRQLGRFLLVGLVNTGVGLACIWGAMWFFGFNDILANIVGYAVGFGISYVLNRGWTFGDRSAATRSLPRWLVVCAIGYLANLAVVLFAHRILGVNAFVAQPLGVGVYTIIGFLGGRHFAFSDGAVREAS